MAPVLELQRMAGNRAVAGLIARDPKTTRPPGKAPDSKKSPPKQSYATVGAMDPLPIESAQFGTPRRTRTDREKPRPTPALTEVVITSYLACHPIEIFQL